MSEAPSRPYVENEYWNVGLPSLRALRVVEPGVQPTVDQQMTSVFLPRGLADQLGAGGW